MAGLGILSVFRYPLTRFSSPLSLQSLWTEYVVNPRSLDMANLDCFENACGKIALYISYHYYRGKGWIVRQGLKMGADWSLYIHGPVFEHSEYEVVVYPDFSQIKGLIYSPKQHLLTVNAILRLTRVSNSVRKRLLICYVVPKPELTLSDLAFPACISGFNVWDICISRFLPTKSRS